MKQRKIKSVFWMVGVVMLSSEASADTKTTTYTYDDLGRVSDVARTSTNISNTHYQYDLADNRTNKTLTSSLPLSTISIANLTVDNKKAYGNAVYKLRSDGYIEITQSQTVTYAGMYTYTTEVTSTAGRWLAEGYSANNFQVSASLANSTGASNCTNGAFYQGLNAGYSASWTMTSASATDRKWCRVYIELREAANPQFLLGSANIVLMAGSGELVTR